MFIDNQKELKGVYQPVGAFYDSKLVIFGGQDEEGDPTNNTYTIDVQYENQAARYVEVLDSMNLPKARYDCGNFVVHNGHL